MWFISKTRQDKKIASTYHKWRSDDAREKYEDVKGFCNTASLKEIKGHGLVLTTGRYVGAENAMEDKILFEGRIVELGKNIVKQIGIYFGDDQ